MQAHLIKLFFFFIYYTWFEKLITGHKELIVAWLQGVFSIANQSREEPSFSSDILDLHAKHLSCLPVSSRHKYGGILMRRAS